MARKIKTKSQLIVHFGIGIIGTTLLMGLTCALFFFIINEGWWDGFPNFFSDTAEIPWWHHMSNWHDGFNDLLYLIRPIIWLLELAFIVVTWVIWAICWIILKILMIIAWIILYCTPVVVALLVFGIEMAFNKKKLGEDGYDYFHVYMYITLGLSIVMVIAMYVCIFMLPVTGFKLF